MRPEKILHEAEVTATGGRDGKAASLDGYSNATRGNIDVKLTVL